MRKIQTPDWILKGKEKSKFSQVRPASFKSSQSKKKKVAGKTFRIRRCPKCSSDKVNVVLTGEEGKSTKEWECKKCKWHGKNIEEEEFTEKEFMKYLDENGEEVS